MTYPTQQYLAQRPDGHTLDGIPGDCYRICVAILLDVPVASIPHFVMHRSSWWHVTRRTVREVRPGWDIECFLPTPWPLWEEPSGIAECQRFAIATGPSPRGPFPHCIVIDSVTGDEVWDPHPSRAGLAGVIEQVDVLIRPYEPDPERPISLPAVEVAAS